MRKTLLLIDGLVLGLVGIHLLFITYKWILNLSITQTIVVITLGAILAFVKFKFVFLRFNNKNILRILDVENKIKFWNFFTPRDLLVIALMMGFGITLRVIFNIPKLYLSSLYLGIGFSLFISFFQYLYVVLFSSNVSKKHILVR